MWPPSSPDINPLDAAVLGIVEREANAVPRHSKDDLMHHIEGAWANISPETVRASCKYVEEHLTKIVRNGGVRFE